MNALIVYYIICIIYCFYQLNKKYKNRGVDYGTSPELDSIMVLVMAWVLAPIDVSITWIRMVREAEEARIRQNKKVLQLYSTLEGWQSWSIALDLKSSDCNRSVGSNPTPSAYCGVLKLADKPSCLGGSENEIDW